MCQADSALAMLLFVLFLGLGSAIANAARTDKGGRILQEAAHLFTHLGHTLFGSIGKRHLEQEIRRLGGTESLLVAIELDDDDRVRTELQRLREIETFEQLVSAVQRARTPHDPFVP
jgi:hypothetical protein